MNIFGYFFHKGHFKGSSKKRAHQQNLFWGGLTTPCTLAPEGLFNMYISNMYPSLPRHGVITVLRRINNEHFKPSMNKKALIELVIISVEFMSFSCNGQCFDQKDGLFIVSPTSLAFAELYIQRFEEIHVYRMIHTPRLLLRKADDTFVITKYDKIETLHEFNKFNCKVQFTFESATCKCNKKVQQIPYRF